MRKQKSKKARLLDLIELGGELGILSQAILTTLPHVVNPQLDDIKKIVTNLIFCTGEILALDYVLNLTRDEKKRKMFGFLFGNGSKNKKEPRNNPRILCENAYKSAKNSDFDGFIESCIKLLSIISYDNSAKALVKKMAYYPSLSSLFAQKSKNEDIRSATNFLFSLMNGEDVMDVYDKYNISKFDENSLLKFYLYLYDKKFDSASKLLKTLLKDSDKYNLAKIESSKNEVFELRFKNYHSGSFILKTLNPSVLKEYTIEKLIFSNLFRKNTPTPLGILNLNSRDYFVQEILPGMPLDKALFDNAGLNKYFYKTLDCFLDIDLQLSEKSNLINLSNVLEKTNYEKVIEESFQKANKDSLDIILDKLYPVTTHLSHASEWFAHGDLHSGNVIVSNDEVLLIDFEKAMLSTKYFDYLFFAGQPIFNLSFSDEMEIINTYPDYKIDDKALFYSTGLFVNLIITTRSSKWYQRNKSTSYRFMERHFLSKTLQYLDKVPLDIDKELLRKIFIDEFND